MFSEIVPKTKSLGLCAHTQSDLNEGTVIMNSSPLQDPSLISIWRVIAVPFLAISLAGCDAPIQAKQDLPVPSVLSEQRGEGLPYELTGTSVYEIPDQKSGRNYQVFVDLPRAYHEQPGRKFPVVYVTDADYAFPVVRSVTRRLNVNKPRVEDFILVGLSYAKGQSPVVSRRRDYTPTAAGSEDSTPDQVHGQGAAYRDYIKTQVMPFVEKRFRTSTGRNYFVGHSYGGLLGAQILFTSPGMFAGYILGSPSFWYDQRHIFQLEKAYAASHDNLSAKVYLYIGEYEAQRKGDKRYYQDFFDMVLDNQAFTQALGKRAYPDLNLKSDVLNDEDHLTVAPRGFTKGLLYLLPANDR